MGKYVIEINERSKKGKAIKMLLETEKEVAFKTRFVGKSKVTKVIGRPTNLTTEQIKFKTNLTKGLREAKAIVAEKV